MAASNSKPADWRWTYVGIAGPFQVISPEGRVAAIVHGVHNDPNKDIPLVAQITKLCAKHAKANK